MLGVREGEKRASLSAHISISSSSTSEPEDADSREAAEASGVRRGKDDDSFSHASSRERRVMRTGDSHKVTFWDPINRFACMRNPKHLMCGVNHDDESRAHSGWQSGDTPWHFTARRTKFQCRQSPKCKWINHVRIWYLGQKNHNNKGQYDRFVKAEKSEE